MRKYFKSFRGSLTTLIIAAILVPLLVSGTIFGVMLENRLRAIFENRLKAGLKTFSLILDYRQHDLIRGLERIASDNTLQMTLELDIVAQMKKYLASQVAVLKFAGVCVADTDNRMIAAAGQPGFSYSLPNMKDNAVKLISSGGELFFGYSVPIVKGEKLLGYALGTMSLTDREFQASLQEKLINSFIMWVDGRPAVSDIAPEAMQKMDNIPRPGRVADIQVGTHRYRTMVKSEDVGGKKLAFAMLLPLDQLKQDFQYTMLTVGSVIAIIIGVIMLFGRRFIRELLRPVTELTAAAAAIDIGSTRIPALETERDDEFGLLNRTFVEMLNSTDRYVTELRQAQKALRKSEERYRVLVDNASEAIFIIQDRVIKFPNPRAEEMIGYTAEEMADMPFTRFIAPEDSKMVLEKHGKRIWNENTPGSYSFRVLKSDGRKVWVLINSVPITWEGRPAALNLMADITELKQMEEELRNYQEKLELMVEERTAELRKTQKELVSKAMEAGRAQLSAMILHNIGNAVTPVIAYLDSLKNADTDGMYRYLVKCYDVLSAKDSMFNRYLADDRREQEVFNYMGELVRTLAVNRETQSDQVDKIDSAISYISEILSLQQSYATAEHEMKARHDLNTLVEDAIRMQVSALEKRDIRVRRELDPNLSDLLIDKNRFMQVLVNLIKNSYEAIDELKDVRENTITFRTFSDNGKIGLEIRDSGIGIDPAFIPQMFNFGKSSKGSTGFGLHYCKIFVEANSGKMSVSSPGRGKGATLSVEFENQNLPK
jgi:PAS domain S-box-containing protein